MSYELPDLKQIKIFREKTGVTRKELANHIKVTQNMITQIETGRSAPSYLKAQQIFKFFADRIRKTEAILEDICSKEVISLLPSSSLTDAKKIFESRMDFDCIPILDLQGNPKGKVTRPGISKIIDNRKDNEIIIHEFMEEPPPIVPYYTPVSWMINFLDPPGCVLITKENKIYGIVVLWDVVTKLKFK